jgi:VRR-NUC domain
LRIGPEDIIQIQVCEWLKNNTDLPFYHYANERKASQQYCSILKRKGVKAGVADLHLPRPNDKFKDLWIELKAPLGKISESQAVFLRQRIEEGSCAHIAYSAEEAILMIKEFYDI